MQSALDGKIRMGFKFVSGVALSIAVLFVSPAFAKAKKVNKASPVSGYYCELGSQNVFVPIAAIKYKNKSGLRKGQRVKFVLSGDGPVNCVAY